ncbi:hypothetical protein NUSPORA_02089 [Nucleospora cyclopteri]
MLYFDVFYNFYIFCNFYIYYNFSYCRFELHDDGKFFNLIISKLLYRGLNIEIPNAIYVTDDIFLKCSEEEPTFVFYKLYILFSNKNFLITYKEDNKICSLGFDGLQLRSFMPKRIDRYMIEVLHLLYDVIKRVQDENIELDSTRSFDQIVYDLAGEKYADFHYTKIQSYLCRYSENYPELEYERFDLEKFLSLFDSLTIELQLQIIELFNFYYFINDQNIDLHRLEYFSRYFIIGMQDVESEEGEVIEIKACDYARVVKMKDNYFYMIIQRPYICDLNNITIFVKYNETFQIMKSYDLKDNEDRKMINAYVKEFIKTEMKIDAEAKELVPKVPLPKDRIKPIKPSKPPKPPKPSELSKYLLISRIFFTLSFCFLLASLFYFYKIRRNKNTKIKLNITLIVGKNKK